MPRHLEPQQPSPTVTQDQEHEQEIKVQRRHEAHIDGGNRLSVILQKRLPGLRRWVRLEVQLPWVLAVLANKAKALVKRQGQLMLEKPTPKR